MALSEADARRILQDETTAMGPVGGIPQGYLRALRERQKIEDPAEYLGRNVGRQQTLADLEELEDLRRTGGPATVAARATAREQGLGQIALAKGMGAGGAGLRRGIEAGQKSYGEAQSHVAVTKQLASEGYAKEIAAGAGMLAMDDLSFTNAIKDAMAAQSQAATQHTADRRAQDIQTLATIAAIVGAGFASDERAKTNVKPITKGAPEDFLRKLNTGGFDYRPEFGGERGRMGPILNEEVANTEVGRSFIRRDPQTGYLMVDPASTALTTMALLKKQDERLQALEKSGKGRK